MHVVIHYIWDPERFSRSKELFRGGPAEWLSLPIHAATTLTTPPICIWQGESVEAVRELVESVVESTA